MCRASRQLKPFLVPRSYPEGRPPLAPSGRERASFNLRGLSPKARLPHFSSGGDMNTMTDAKKDKNPNIKAKVDPAFES